MRYLFIALVLALALCGWGLKQQIAANAVQKAELSTKTEALERAARRVKSDARVLVAREAEIASTGRKLARAESALVEALQRNKDWSNTNVPTLVQEALAGPSDTLAGDSGVTMIDQ